MCKPVITAYIIALQCLGTLVPPKGRGGMSSGRLKYIILKKYPLSKGLLLFKTLLAKSYFG
jgi:hypothetical protein